MDNLHDNLLTIPELFEMVVSHSSLRSILMLMSTSTTFLYLGKSNPSLPWISTFKIFDNSITLNQAYDPDNNGLLHGLAKLFTGYDIVCVGYRNKETKMLFIDSAKKIVKKLDGMSRLMYNILTKHEMKMFSLVAAMYSNCLSYINNYYIVEDIQPHVSDNNMLAFKTIQLTTDFSKEEFVRQKNYNCLFEGTILKSRAYRLVDLYYDIMPSYNQENVFAEMCRRDLDVAKLYRPGIKLSKIKLNHSTVVALKDEIYSEISKHEQYKVDSKYAFEMIRDANYPLHSYNLVYTPDTFAMAVKHIIYPDVTVCDYTTVLLKLNMLMNFIKVNEKNFN